MSLQHEMAVARPRVPELNAPILGPAQHPFAIGSERNTEHEILRTQISILNPGLVFDTSIPCGPRMYERIVLPFL